MRAIAACLACAFLLVLGSFVEAPTARASFDKVVGVAKSANPRAAAIAPGPRKTGVILFNFSGDSSQPWSVAGARSEVFTGSQSANAFYEEESYGGISLTGDLRADGDVFGWFTINAPGGGCPYQEWVQKADEAATNAGAVLGSYQNLIYMFPFQISCPWIGLAGVGGGGGPAGGNGPVGALINGDYGGGVIIHELGHTFGLFHAGSWTCTSGGVRVQVSDNCTATEYGDPFDVMGDSSASRHNSGWNLAKLGILKPENIETIDASGTYSMRSALHPTTDPTVLRIPRERAADGDVTSWYYLEVRESGGVFESVADAADTGVSIRVAPNPAGSPETLLLDANPATATFQDAPLAVGETFNGGPVRVKTLSASGGSAAVTITLDEEAPTTPSDLTATGGEEQVQLQWSASSDNFGVERYRVFRDGSEVGTTTSTSFLDAPAPVGDHEYVVYAEDATGNLSAASDPATATAVPDEEPPSRPDNLTATVGTKGVQLQWTASNDNVGVENYVVFRDGSELASPAEVSFLDPLASIGGHEYVVYAEDAVGNRSAASDPVTTTVPGVSGPECASGSCGVTFRYTGTAATWTVPPGVAKADFTVEGARGGSDSPQSILGRGARVIATLGSLTAGEDATVSVGGAGKAVTAGGAGGFNGGGDGGLGGGGGGFSSVSFGSSLMLLAGGGGGKGSSGFNAIAGTEPSGGAGGSGGREGTRGSVGVATEVHGANLTPGSGGAPGGEGGAGGAGGEVTATSSCPGGAGAGSAGASGGSFAGGTGVSGAGGGGGGGGYVGGGQGGGGAGDACGDRAGSGGGGGGSSFAAAGITATISGGFRRSDGEISIAYANPITLGKRSYLTLQGQELVVPAESGLLSGAPGPDGDSLTVSLTSPPTHGTSTINDDGSFAYIPTSGYAGGDSFTYRAGDAAGDYSTAQVTLTVAVPPTAEISAPAAGGTYVTGQSVSTAFSCSEGAGGTGMFSCTDSNGIKTGSGGFSHLDTSTVGAHTYTVTALSKDGLTSSTSIDYTVTPKPGPSQPPAEPSDEPTRPLFGIELSLGAQKESLRELLRTGKLTVTAEVSKAAKVVLTGRAKLTVRTQRTVQAKFVEVFKAKTISFGEPSERYDALTLSKRGREALQGLSKAKLTIAGKATDASGELARRTVVLTLQR